MKIYQFYSDYNDSWNSDIHQDIRWKVSTSNAPMPEKYRSPELDLWITDFGPMPEYITQFKAIQIWYSKKSNQWKIEFYGTDDPDKIRLVKEKYLDTFKQINKWPDFVPQDVLYFLIKIHFVDYDEYRKLNEQYNVKYHIGYNH